MKRVNYHSESQQGIRWKYLFDFENFFRVFNLGYRVKLLFAFMLSATLLTSCYTEELHVNNNTPAISLNQLLQSYDLWYVDINATQGFGETPFLQIAFTLSFDNGRVFANNLSSI